MILDLDQRHLWLHSLIIRHWEIIHENLVVLIDSHIKRVLVKTVNILEHGRIHAIESRIQIILHILLRAQQAPCSARSTSKRRLVFLTAHGSCLYL